MKKTIVMMLCVMGLLWGVSNANATSYNLGTGLNDPYVVGFVVPGLPSADFDDFLDYLLGMTLGDTDYGVDGDDYYRSMLGGLAYPVYDGVKTDTDVAPTITIGNIDYIMAKYDASRAGSIFWYVGGLNSDDTVTLPQIFGQQGISHYAVWGETSVPEPMSLLLLGLGLVGLAGVGRKLKK